MHDDVAKTLEAITVRLEKKLDRIDQQIGLILSAVKSHQQRISLLESEQETDLELVSNGSAE